MKLCTKSLTFSLTIAGTFFLDCIYVLRSLLVDNLVQVSGVQTSLILFTLVELGDGCLVAMRKDP